MLLLSQKTNLKNLLLSQKTNLKNNHCLAYIVFNISEEMKFESFNDKNNNISNSIFKES